MARSLNSGDLRKASCERAYWPEIYPAGRDDTRRGDCTRIGPDTAILSVEIHPSMRSDRAVITENGEPVDRQW